MGVFFSGLFLGIGLGIISIFVISVCLVNKDKSQIKKYNESYNIGNIIKLKLDLNDEPELKGIHINVGIDKSNLISFIIDTEITHDVLTAINRKIINFEDLLGIKLNYIIITNEEIKKNDIKFKHYV